MSTQVIAQKDPKLNSRFERHGSMADLLHYDGFVRQVRLLRNTGALQSLVYSRVLVDNDYVSTGKFRLIRGVTGDVILYRWFRSL